MWALVIQICVCVCLCWFLCSCDAGFIKINSEASCLEGTKGQTHTKERKLECAFTQGQGGWVEAEDGREDEGRRKGGEDGQVKPSSIKQRGFLPPEQLCFNSRLCLAEFVGNRARGCHVCKGMHARVAWCIVQCVSRRKTGSGWRTKQTFGVVCMQTDAEKKHSKFWVNYTSHSSFNAARFTFCLIDRD